MTQLYQLKRYQRINKLSDKIFIGALPPRATVIDDAPTFLKGLLSFFSEPRTLEEGRDYLKGNCNLSESERDAVLQELLNNDIISKPIYEDEDRYTRHYLYYDLIGIDPLIAQQVLSQKKVGLVGTGGIGSNVAMILAGAGVGTLVFSDGDKIEESNLTRQFLYNESDIGQYKVETAAKHLKLLNSTIKVVPIVESIAGEDLFDRHFGECDFIVLSADSPVFIHEWINNAALKYGFAYSNAGYIESFGVVGPLVVPGETACYECLKQVGDLYRHTAVVDEVAENLNKNFQAPSYGALNTLVASIQANEVIRFLLAQEVKTKGTRLLINSENYRIYEEKFERNIDCLKCRSTNATVESVQNRKNNEKSLSQVYAEERESDSFNAILLDGLMERLVKIRPNIRILDVGCATGEQAIRFAQKGGKVLAIDISRDMIDSLNTKIQGQLSELLRTMVGDVESLNINEQFDIVVCNNILDYLPDIRTVLRKLKSLLEPGGTMIVTLPHPIKDRGEWQKEYYNGRWNYEKFTLHGYFEEGSVIKSREDSQGNVVIESIKTYHRTTETYFNSFVQAGFQVVGLFEPKPSSMEEQTHPILFEKCSRIPYFQTFVLKRND